MHDEPFFLFLGEADREGVVSKLKALGAAYVKKRLESRLENWGKIEQLLKNDQLMGILAKINTNSFSMMASPSYVDATERVFSLISQSPNIVFIHESFFVPGENRRLAEADDTGDGFYPSIFGEVPDNVRQIIGGIISNSNVNVIPYRTNAEVTVISSEFIDQNERNLIFRLYVPNGKIWAREVDRLLTMFRDYLSSVERFHVRQDQYITGKGVVYEFVGDDHLNRSTLPVEFAEFSRFVDLCMSNPAEANQVLSSKHIDRGRIGEIVDRYAKEGRRLQIDLKQERERRLLSIRHRMEAELVDVVTDPTDWERLNTLIDSQVPLVSGVAGALGFGGSRGVARPQAITVNVNPQFVETVHGIVAQEISGNQHIGTEAAQIIELIKLYGGTRAAELNSAVYELEDPETKAPERISAAGRVKSFLYLAAGKTADVGFGILQSYVEKKLGL